MEVYNKIKDKLNNSIFGELLKKDSITDISFNGSDIFYMDTLNGRIHFKKEINYEEIKNLIKDIANLLDINFSISSPLLDVSFLNYRLNAIHESISKKNYQKRLVFSIRIFSNELKIANNNEFFDKKLFNLILFFLKLKFSFCICGNPSCGKTEFQKYLINLFSENERIVIIDSINELDFNYSNSDVTLLVPNKQKFSNINDLIKISLRLNPDYLILAEARGEEFVEVFKSSLTGISTITTIHSNNIDQLISRLLFILKNSNENIDFVNKDNLLNIFNIIVFVNKKMIGLQIKRYISEIYLSFENKNYVIYKSDYVNKNFYKFPINFVKLYKNLLLKNNVERIFYE